MIGMRKNPPASVLRCSYPLFPRLVGCFPFRRFLVVVSFDASKHDARKRLLSKFVRREKKSRLANPYFTPAMCTACRTAAYVHTTIRDPRLTRSRKTIFKIAQNMLATNCILQHLSPPSPILILLFARFFANKDKNSRKFEQSANWASLKTRSVDLQR